MSLKSDLLKVSGSNLIVLLSSITNGLVLPYILSIDGFADLKTYGLYAGFIGFLHFGFVDGLNVKYGGNSYDEINKKEFDGYHNFFISFQFFILIIVLLIGCLLKNTIILLVGMAILPINLQSFFLFFYQAVGEFKEYAIASIIVPIVTIIITLLLVFAGVLDYKFYAYTTIFGYLVSILFLELKYKRYTNFHFHFSLNPAAVLDGFKKNKAIFVSGFFIMLGNVLFTMFFDSGRWISKLYTNDEGFAKYSLGLSLIGFIVIFIGTINKTFYPYLYRNNGLDTILKYKGILYLIGSFSLLGFFILKVIITLFLPKYLDSLPLTAILMTSIPGMIIIQSIYVNLYKVQKKEKIFLFDTLLYLTVAIILSLSFYMYFKSLTSIAIATVISIYIWAIFPKNCIQIKIKDVLKDLTYIVLVIIFFWIVYSLNFNLIVSFSILFFLLLFLNFLFFKKLVLNLFKSRL